MAISESELHSYIDGQLADEERAGILAETRVSARLSRQLAEFRALNDLIRIAYPAGPQPGHERDARG